MAPSYKTHDPIGWCGNASRGAALGRGSYHAEDQEAPVKLYLRKVSLDNGGYDVNGTYFGHGEPLYWVADSESNIDFMLRARSRESAKQQVLADYPNAKFFR